MSSETADDFSCVCGYRVKVRDDGVDQELEKIVLQYNVALEEGYINEIRRYADKISYLILSSDIPAVDIEIEKKKLRSLIAAYFPEREYLYDMLYESRFTRLWQQFREKGLT